MVVIEQLDTGLAAELTKGVDLLNHSGETGTAGTGSVIQEGNGDELAADGLMIGDGAKHVSGDGSTGNMTGDGDQTGLIQHSLNLLCGMTIETGELYTGIAHGLQLGEHTLEVSLSFFAGGIYLICYGELLHNYPLFRAKAHFMDWLHYSRRKAVRTVFRRNFSRAN